LTSPSSGSFLDFFVLEANEYVEQLDGLILRSAGSRAPDAEAVQRAARALRGSATMAKLPSLADLASAVEAVGRAMRQGTLTWDPAIKGVLTSAVDDFKILVRAARTWSATEDERARKRIAEISQFVQPPPGAATPVAVSGAAFFSTEASNIAAGLELLATRPEDRTGGMQVLARVRALRGVAGVGDIPGLAEVLEAAESGVRPLELGETKLSAEHVNLLRASTALMRTIASGIPTRESVTSSTPQYKSFLFALDAVVAQKRSDRVVPIADLFYHDKGPHIVSVAPNPPTTPAQRFRMEVVSLGEHLHRVIDEARRATDAIHQEHARGELGRALRAIRSTAASFGQAAVAQTVEAHLERTGDLNSDALNAISNFAASISPAPVAVPHRSSGDVPLRPTHVKEVTQAIGTKGPLPSTPPPPAPDHARVFAAVQPAAVAAAAPGPLDATIAAFESLAAERMAEPVAIDDLIPVDTLFYRGRAALDRAVEVRNTIRQAGGSPATELLEELYDLVELARADSI
jgi:chemotaxis protein histidine kinase CheA